MLVKISENHRFELTGSFRSRCGKFGLFLFLSAGLSHPWPPECRKMDEHAQKMNDMISTWYQKHPKTVYPCKSWMHGWHRRRLLSFMTQLNRISWACGAGPFSILSHNALVLSRTLRWFFFLKTSKVPTWLVCYALRMPWTKYGWYMMILATTRKPE
jgi:hypothetical protein